MRSHLSIWVVYDHPRDWPRFYVARRYEGVRPTDRVIMDVSIERLRRQLQKLGLVKLMPDPSDDPVIMETWL